MRLPIAPVNIVFELICFAAFAMICGGLLKPRFSVKTSLLITAGCLAVVTGIQTAILLASDGSIQLVLTLLPATAYLPVILTVHLLSKNGFATAVATWSFGLLAPYILGLLRDLLQLLLVGYRSYPFDWLWLTVLCSLVLAAALVFTALRFCRKPFQQFAFRNKYVWIIVPVILAFSLVSYVENVNFNPLLAGILFLSLLAAFLFVTKFLNVAMSEQTARASERAIAAQLELQREEIARIRQKVEQGRIYRHDMRHHLLVLEELADRKNADGVRQYIGDLNNQLSSVEREDYCENTTVNAVLASYIGRAKQQDIRVTVKARIPQELPADEIDICTILANALDNAVAACRENENNRWIELSSALHDNGNFSIDIRNACDTPVEFDKDGMPVSHKGKGHGIGLKSIHAVVQKYNGLLRCTCDNQVFRFSAALFQQDTMPTMRSSGIKKTVSNTAVTILLALCFINAFPDAVQALETVPVIGNVLHLANFRTHHSSFNWGSSSLEVSFPQIEWEESVSGLLNGTPGNNGDTAESDTSNTTGTETDGGHTNPQTPTMGINPDGSQSTPSDSQSPETTQPSDTGSAKPITPPSEPIIPETTPPTQPTDPDTDEPVSPPDISNGIEDMNQQMEAYVQAVKEEFLWYFSQKYQGFVASDTGYNILRNDDSLLSICFYTTLNVGGSGEYSRCFTLDKTTGKVLTLSDLFTEDSDYIGVISADILRQMTEQAEAGEGDYFIPGGIWSPEECFQAIAADQNFYIDENNKLVIIFDEYEVAPGSMGMPRFTVETAVLNDILLRPSLLSMTGKEAG
ncbi:MAG: GHKL domain-containing protein [Oscillospiraceae bacterium]|jgi:hypothetical protein